MNKSNLIGQHLQVIILCRCYGGEQSLRGWNCNRLTLSHEPRSEERKQAAQLSEKTRLKRAKKDHTDKIATIYDMGQKCTKTRSGIICR